MIALAFKQALELVGQFYYLPVMPAIMVTAIATGWRGPTLLAIGLAIAANVLQVERESLVDVTANALLFTGVCWLIAEMCWRLRAMQSQAGELSRHLARRNEMLDAILASAPVVTLDRDARIRFLTPAACAVLGTDAEDAIGRAFHDFVDGFSLGAMPGASEANDVVWTGRRADGATYPLGIHLGLMTDDPEGAHATLSLTDLTQAHAADARARELHGQLNRVWRLNSLGEMAAALAHELNQPLTAATNYLHTSQMTADKAGLMGESISHTIELAKNQLLRAGAIIRRMRELLAHETRSLGVERVAPMIADMHGVLGMIERNADVTIEYQIDDLNDRVQAERIQFQQAIINLIRNAVEALEGQDDRRVRIVGRPVSAEHYELRVEDSGCGISAEQLEKIFRPLMTTKSAGMGLGLSVTRTIVESHGGALTVGRSALGGAVFAFSLMREREPENA
jgi:two-component system sensor kinase FixL